MHIPQSSITLLIHLNPAKQKIAVAIPVMTRASFARLIAMLASLRFRGTAPPPFPPSRTKPWEASTPSVTRPGPSGIRATRPASGRLANRACRVSRGVAGLATSVPCGPSSPGDGSRGSRRRGTDASAARRSGGKSRSTCTAARRHPCRLRRPRRRSGASVCASFRFVRIAGAPALLRISPTFQARVSAGRVARPDAHLRRACRHAPVDSGTGGAESHYRETRGLSSLPTG